MLNLLIYLLEVSVLTSIFYLFYRYLYFKLAYFELCRYYFFMVLVISFILPIIPSIFEVSTVNLRLHALFNTDNTNGIHGINYINVDDSFLNDEQNIVSKLPLVKILFIIWISGLVRYLFIISKNILSIIRLIRKGIKQKDENIILTKTSTGNGAFTFFRHVFINEAFNGLSEKEQKQILQHEKIHVKQLHSLDNILFELMRAVLWFNPVSKLISANIKIVHEFIVDNKLTGNKNVPDYSRLILKMAVHNSHALAVSSFSNEEIKNRIKLISYPESEKIRKKRFITSLPVLIITVFAAWIIISTVNLYAQDRKAETAVFEKPFKNGTFKIISPFFENKTPSEVYTGFDRNIDKNEQYRISHRETAYEVKSFTKVYAIESGIVSHIKKDNVFDLEEYTVELELITGQKVVYKGLFSIIVQEDNPVKRGEIIGLTGDIRLYPTVSIQLFENGKATDPELYY